MGRSCTAAAAAVASSATATVAARRCEVAEVQWRAPVTLCEQAVQYEPKPLLLPCNRHGRGECGTRKQRQAK